MKLKINYDLLQKIKESNEGYTLNKATKRVALYTGISSAIGVMDNIAYQKPIEEFIMEVSTYLLVHSILTASVMLAISNIFKKLSKTELETLSRQLKSLNLDTNQELLMETYRYKTEYQLKDGKHLLPSLEQRKYLMVPTMNNGEVVFEQLVQEHVIGGKEYTLSMGAPKGTYKLVYKF